MTRARFVVTPCAIALVAALAPGLAFATPKVTIQGKPSCPTRSALRSALEARAPDAGGALVVKPRGKKRVQVRYRPAARARTFQRTIDTRECRSVPEAIALLVESWSRQSVRGPTASRGRATETRRAERPSEAVETPREQAPLAESPPAQRPAAESRPVRSAPAAPEPERPLAVAAAPVPPEPSPPEPAARAAPHAPRVHSEAPRAASGGSWHMALAAFGSGGMLLGGDVSPSATGRLELGGDRLAVGLQYRWEGPRTASLAPGSVTARTDAADIVLQWALHPPDSSGIRLHVGGGLQRIAAQASGYTENESATLYDPEVVGGVEWHLRVAGGLFFRVFAGGEWRWRTEVLEVTPYGAVMTLSPWGFRAGAGVGWTLF